MDSGKRTLRVEVVYALRDEQMRVALDVAPGTTVGEAIRRSGILDRFPRALSGRGRTGIFGRPTGLDARLEDGDRVEIYRPLAVDPREARRARAGRRSGGSR
jgi:putative ubiquitin-RnfH superfamily antitoxin RatB of RatAB toxin-antitoxin module